MNYEKSIYFFNKIITKNHNLNTKKRGIFGVEIKPC